VIVLCRWAWNEPPKKSPKSQNPLCTTGAREAPQHTKMPTNASSSLPLFLTFQPVNRPAEIPGIVPVAPRPAPLVHAGKHEAVVERQGGVAGELWGDQRLACVGVVGVGEKGVVGRGRVSRAVSQSVGQSINQTIDWSIMNSKRAAFPPNTPITNPRPPIKMYMHTILSLKHVPGPACGSRKCRGAAWGGRPAALRLFCFCFCACGMRWMRWEDNMMYHNQSTVWTSTHTV
jgi:hypothetical protein